MSKLKTKKAKVYKTDGTIETIEFNSKNQLEVFQKAVGGLIQPVTVIVQNKKPFSMILNEEGLTTLDLPFNPYSHEITEGSIWEYSPFYGNIVVLDSMMR